MVDDASHGDYAIPCDSLSVAPFTSFLSCSQTLHLMLLTGCEFTRLSFAEHWADHSFHDATFLTADNTTWMLLSHMLVWLAVSTADISPGCKFLTYWDGLLFSVGHRTK